MTQIRKLERIRTGTPGLDFVLDGGLFETGVYIIQGGAGCGKTTLANQICFHQAQHGKAAVYYTLLTESHDRMLAFMHPMEFFDANKVGKGVSYVSGFKLLEAEGLPGVVRSVRDIMANQRPSLFVIDGVVTAEEIAPSDTVFKKFLHEIQMAATMFRCTVILLTNTDAAKRLQAEHTMVDGIIELRLAGSTIKTQRSVEVSKFRGGAQKRGPHTLIIDNRGIHVEPRIETTLAAAGQLPRPTSRDRVSFGIPELDAMLGGGLLAGSNTLVLGSSGTLKTTLGMHFLNAAAAAGEKGLFFTFYEQYEELLERARRLGLDAFARSLESGHIRLDWASSVEANLDELGNRLVRAFDEHRPSRVFIDGINGFEVTEAPAARLHDFFAAISDYFTAQQASFVYTSELQDLTTDPVVRPPFPNVSRACQNILLLRYAQVGDSIEKLFSIVKTRDSDFDRSLRIARVATRGVELVRP